MSLRKAIRVLLHPDEWFHVQEIHDHCRSRFEKWDEEDRIKLGWEDMSHAEKIEEVRRTSEAEGKKMEALKIGKYFSDQVEYRILALNREYSDLSRNPTQGDNQ